MSAVGVQSSVASELVSDVAFSRPRSAQTSYAATLFLAATVDSTILYFAMDTTGPPYKTFGKRRSQRLSNFDYHQPYVYHLIWGTHNRRPVLAAESLATRFVELLIDSANAHQIMIYAYCFMPDHVHLLLSPTEKERDLITFTQRYKSRSTRIYWEEDGTGKLWQRSFYDHVLRNDEDVQKIVRYILENPVRKGLIEDYRLYPFSGSLVFRKEDL